MFTSSWDGYGGNKSNYKIVDKYTKSEKNGTKQVLVQDNEWRTSAPFRWLWENDWKVYSTRTTYSYRTRNMKWNADSNLDYENVPLNYSLYNKNGTPIQGGIKWTYGAKEKKFTKEKDRNFFEGMIAESGVHERNLNIDMYYITSKDVMKKVRDNLEKTQMDLYTDEAQLGSYIVNKIVDALRDAGLVALAKTAQAGGMGAITVAMLEYIDTASLYGDLAAFVEYIAKLNTAIESNSHQCIVLSFVHNVTAVVIPSRKTRLGIKEAEYVSMLYDYEFARDQGLEYYIPKGAEAYGSISYMSSNSMWNEINTKLENIFTWETVYPWDLIG